LDPKNQNSFLRYWKERVLGPKEKLFGTSSQGERAVEMCMSVSQEIRWKEWETSEMSEKNFKELISRSGKARKHCWMEEGNNLGETEPDHNRRLSMIEMD
jgi:hypothetical protein